MDEQINNMQAFAEEVADIQTPEQELRILLPGGRIKIRDTARVIYEESKKRQSLFYRGGNITKAETLPGETTITFKPLKAPEARSEFEKYGTFVTCDKNKWSH